MFEYRVQYRNQARIYSWWDHSVTEEAAERGLANLIASGYDAWIERRPLGDWERV